MAPLSEEEENYVRFVLLLKGLAPRAVHIYFDREFPPSHLPSILIKYYNTLYDLRKKRILNQTQWNILFPTNGVPDSKTFDITLMICLIRNLTSVTQPFNGFDSLPLPMEKTPEADLARIKWHRHYLTHHDSSKMATGDFKTAWSDISDAIGRLGGPALLIDCDELRAKLLYHSAEQISHIKETESSSSSALPMYSRKNYARIVHALQQLFPDILRELIATKKSPQTLVHDVNTDRYLSKHLRADEFLFIDNVEAIGYAYFDIPLIYKLVRLLKLVPSPTKGWNHSTAPCRIEVTPGDDLERIRRLRNEFLHRGTSQVTYTEFSQYFIQYLDIAGRLETYIGKQTGEYVDKFILLETCDIDEETTNLYCKRFERLLNSIDDIDDDEEIVHAIEKDINALKERKESIDTKAFQARPTTVRDDVEKNGYKGMKNKGRYGFYLLDIVCDDVVIDCIIDRRLEKICRMSVTEFQECTDEIKQLRQAQSTVHEKVNENFLHFVKRRKSFLCQYFLNHTSFNTIKNNILVNALYISIKNDDAETAKFIGWQLARNVLKSISVPLYDIWLASLCMCSGRKTTKPNSFFCSTTVTIIIMVPQLIDEIIDNFEGIPIKQVAYYCEIFKEANAISKARTQLLEKDINTQCHVPGPLAEQLFNNHRRLTLVCPSDIKSKDFPTVPMFLTRSCIQLYCYVKGAIPIGENHFPGELQGIPTDVIEGFSRFCSNKLRIGDSVTNTRMTGTLGGFCRFYGRDAFLTCAHAMIEWDTLLSTELEHHVQPQYVNFYTGDKILNETLFCGKVVNHSFTHDNSLDTSTDVALIDMDNAISVSENDYVKTKTNGPIHYARLGMKSRYLHDGHIRKKHKLYGKNVKVVCPGAVSGWKDPDTSLILHKPKSSLAVEDVESASANLRTRSMEYIETHVKESVHTQIIAITNASRTVEAESDRAVRFYNQLAVPNIPFQQGDSGSCVYITDGNKETGCLGMAIATLPEGGCIVTPMDKLLQKLDLIKPPL